MKDNEPASTRPFTLFATIAAAIFVGGSSSLFVQHILAPAEAPRHVEDSTPSAAVDPRLAEALIQLTQELRESRASASHLTSPSAESGQRSVATESGQSVLAELAAAVRELRGALQQAGGSGAPMASLAPLTRPNVDRRAWLAEPPTDDTDHEIAYSREHMFWSEQQVLEKYGVPDAIHVRDNGVVVWSYEDPDDGKRSFFMQFAQGRVFHVEGP